MSAARDERLIQMANQIAANLAAQGDSAATELMAQHILDFWDPAMRAAILAVAPARLSSIARGAVEQIASG